MTTALRRRAAASSAAATVDYVQRKNDRSHSAHLLRRHRVRRDEHARVLARHITICVDFDGLVHARRNEDLEELLRNGEEATVECCAPFQDPAGAGSGAAAVRPPVDERPSIERCAPNYQEA